MPWLQTNVALYVRIGPAYWVPLHERDPVRDRTQRHRAAQRAPRASCHRRGACCAHLIPQVCLEMFLILHIDQHYGPL